MPFYIVVIIISFWVSLVGMLVKENRLPPLVLFPFFLLLSAAVEYYGEQLSAKNINTIGLYNFFTVFEFVFYLLFFWFIFVHPVIKKTVLVVIVFYLAIALLNIFFFQGKKNFHTYTYIIGCILIVTFSIIYFYFLFRFPDTGSLSRNPFFWIATGLMFYYTCSFSLYGLENFITKTMLQYNRLLFFIGDLLNILLYTSFSIGFLCKINFRKLPGLS